VTSGLSGEFTFSGRFRLHMITVQSVKSPTKTFLEIIEKRLSRSSRDAFKMEGSTGTPGAVGLIHGNIVEVLAAIDIGEKAARVSIFEIMGTCQQHFNTIAIFGDVASVDLALQAIEFHFKAKK
jgi:hypothetical protein